MTKKFPSRNFLTASALDAESWDLAMEIAENLKRDGWNWISCDNGPRLPPRDGRPASCLTIPEPQIQIEGSKDLIDVMQSLADALRDPAVLGMARAVPEISPAYPTVMIIVGTKT